MSDAESAQAAISRESDMRNALVARDFWKRQYYRLQQMHADVAEQDKKEEATRRVAPEAAQPEPAKTEPKPEAVRLYCVKPLTDWLTTGKTYESVGRWITVDNGDRHVTTAMISAGHLFPLVARPARVGETILPIDKWFSCRGITEKKTYVVEEVDGDGDVWFDGGSRCANTERLGVEQKYLVLDGYAPKQPESDAEKIARLEAEVARYKSEEGFYVGTAKLQDLATLRTENAQLEKQLAAIADLCGKG